jgi:hypothetical protein
MMTKLEVFAYKAFCFLLLIPLGGLWLVGVIFIWYGWFSQAMGWLKSGVWDAYSAIDLLAEIGIQWAISPESWLGIYQILSWLNGYFFVGFVGALLVVTPAMICVEYLKKEQL